MRLVNGEDLTNFVEVGKEKWTVEDGTIHGQGVASVYGYLRTEKNLSGGNHQALARAWGIESPLPHQTLKR